MDIKLEARRFFDSKTPRNLTYKFEEWQKGKHFSNYRLDEFFQLISEKLRFEEAAINENDENEKNSIRMHGQKNCAQYYIQDGCRNCEYGACVYSDPDFYN